MLAVRFRQEFEGSDAIQQRLHPSKGNLGRQDSQYAPAYTLTSNAASDKLNGYQEQPFVCDNTALQGPCLGVERCTVFLRAGCGCSDWFPMRLHWRADHWQGRTWTAAAGDQAAAERHQLGRLCYCGMQNLLRMSYWEHDLYIKSAQDQFGILEQQSSLVCCQSSDSVILCNAISCEYMLLLHGHPVRWYDCVAALNATSLQMSCW